MSNDTFDPVTAIAFSSKNDPASWSAPTLDGLEFANHAEAKKAEALFNRLISERDELAAALIVAFEAMDRMRECAEGKHIGSESEIVYQLNKAQDIVQAALARVAKPAAE